MNTSWTARPVRTRRRRRTGALVAGALAVTLMAAGCGSSSDDGGNSTPAGSADAKAPASAPAKDPTLDELFAAGKTAQPPAAGPAATTGKTVWWVSCGMSIPDCSVASNAAKEAASAIGWKFKIADAQLNANNGNDRAFREALAARPDAIVVYGIACNTITSALNEAKQAKVPVMGVEALDCSDPPLNGPHLYTAPMAYTETAMNTSDFFKAWGTASGVYMATKLGAKGGDIVTSHGTEPNHELVNTAYEDVIKSECTACKIVAQAAFSSPDLTPDGPYVQRLQAALAKNPNAAAAFLPFGVNMLLGGAKDAKNTNPKMLVSGGSGYGAEIDLLRKGLVDGITAHDVQWTGWGAIDNLNRLFAGKPAAAQGLGFVIVDKTHNLPPKGQPYQSAVDFRSAYKKLWAAGAR